jgi:hypothetical protein
MKLLTIQMITVLALILTAQQRSPYETVSHHNLSSQSHHQR